MLRNAGERGLLAQLPGRHRRPWPRPPACSRRVPRRIERGTAHEQREAILAAFAHYHPSAMIVFDVDFGHTDPQWVLPYGGTITVDGPSRRITAHYG